MCHLCALTAVCVCVSLRVCVCVCVCNLCAHSEVHVVCLQIVQSAAFMRERETHTRALVHTLTQEKYFSQKSAATHCTTLQHTATRCITLRHTCTHTGPHSYPKEISLANKFFNTLQHTATHCNTLQHTAAHCSTLQHTATHMHAHWSTL